MSLALEQPQDLHRCKSGVALEQETFSGLPGPHPNKTTCSFSCRFRGNPGNPGIVPDNQGRKASNSPEVPKTSERKPLQRLPLRKLLPTDRGSFAALLGPKLEKES